MSFSLHYLSCHLRSSLSTGGGVKCRALEGHLVLAGLAGHAVARDARAAAAEAERLGRAGVLGVGREVTLQAARLGAARAAALGELLAVDRPVLVGVAPLLGLDPLARLGREVVAVEQAVELTAGQVAGGAVVVAGHCVGHGALVGVRHGVRSPPGRPRVPPENPVCNTPLVVVNTFRKYFCGVENTAQ